MKLADKRLFWQSQNSKITSDSHVCRLIAELNEF